MREEPRRRVWTHVDTTRTADGMVVTLDGRALRVPGGPTLVLGTERLAKAVAGEWAAAGGGVLGGAYHPDALVLTALAGTAQQRVRPDRGGAIGRLMAFLDGDALCYRASHPSGLVRRQDEEWQPWLDWLEARTGARLVTTEGVMPIGQSVEAAGRVRALLDGLDEAAVTGLGVLTPASGSLVLGLAVVLGDLPAVDAHRLSLLDELDQAERWGQDSEAAARHAGLLSDFVTAERFVGLARPVAATHLLVSGRVQGVGYRAWLQGEAKRVGVSGWVRNLRDGRVEAMLAGPDPARRVLVEAAVTGPGGAVVTDVLAVPATGGVGTGVELEFELRGFAIRPTAAEPVTG